jgi:uncharacterized membrane protein YbaN (DUF454 family)
MLSPPLREDGSAESGTGGESMAPVRRVCYFALGWVFVGFATAGVILPGVPATPFLLPASYFFVRSSPRTHRWLLRSRLFGPFLRDWHEHRGVRRSVKVVAVAMIVVVSAISIFSNQLPAIGIGAIAFLSMIGLTVVVLLPEVPATASREQPDEQQGSTKAIEKTVN